MTSIINPVLCIHIASSMNSIGKIFTRLAVYELKTKIYLLNTPSLCVAHTTKFKPLTSRLTTFYILSTNKLCRVRHTKAWGI